MRFNNPGAEMKHITFVRVLRTPGMKRGFAVDVSGKRWRGFRATRTPEEIHHSAFLGNVGVCFICRGRVYEGWECMDSRRDVCDDCVRHPEKNKTFVVGQVSRREWKRIEREFFRNASFIP